MKSKMKRRMLAIVLCMVIVLSNSSFIFASSESGAPAVEAPGTGETTPQTETDTQVPETTPEAAAKTVSEPTPAPTEEPAAPTPEAPTPAPTQAPTATPEATAAPTPAPEGTPVPTPAEILEETTTPAPAATTETTAIPTPAETPEGTPAPTVAAQNGASNTVPPTVAPTPTETPVKSNEAVELKQEFKDSEGKVTSTVKAQIPEGTFAADASEITMEVRTPEVEAAEHVKEMMEENLPEHYMLGDYILYDIQFKVNGTVTEPQKPITITFEGEELSVKDVKRANVFWLDPEDPQVDGDKDQLVEITQKSEMIENLQKAGQSTENIDDYDLSEITLKEDGISDKIQMEGRTSTVYGCYVETLSEEKTMTQKVGDITVSVKAPEGAFSVNSDLVTMTADPLTEEQKELVEEQLQKQADAEGMEVREYVAYDINLWADGEKIQPQIPVTVTFENTGLESYDADDATGFQVDETSEQITTIEEISRTEEKVEVTAEHFTITGAYIAAGNGNTPVALEADNNESLAESYWPTGIETNEWQIVKENYKEDGNSAEPYFPSDNNTDVRIQKNVLPTENENEFYIYLNVEPQLSWEEVFAMASVWVFNSHSDHKILGSDEIPEGANAEQIKDWVKRNGGSGANVSNLVGDRNLIDATNKNSTVENVTAKYVIVDQSGNRQIIEIPNLCYKLPSSDIDSILIKLPFQDHYTQLSVELENKVLNIEIDQDWFFQGTGNYVLQNNKIDLDSVMDPMGDFIEFKDIEAATNESTAQESNGTITWSFPQDQELSTDFQDYEIVDLGNGVKTVYWKHAYELVYKIRLDTKADNFEFGKVYDTNKTTTLTYSTETEKDKTAVFRIPAVQSRTFDSFVSVDKTVEVVDYDKRTYRITLSAKSILDQMEQQGEPVDVILVFDTSKSMDYPADLEEEGEEKYISQLDPDETYYFIRPTSAATVYKVTGEKNDYGGVTWYYVDSSKDDSERKKVTSDSEYLNTKGKFQFYKRVGDKTRLDYLQEAAKNFVDNLNGLSSENRVGLVTFAEEVNETVERGYVPIDTLSSNYESLTTAFDNMENFLNSGTNQYAALQKANSILNDNKGSENDQYVILLTDGAPNWKESGKTVSTSESWNKIETAAEKVRQNATLMVVGVGITYVDEGVMQEEDGEDYKASKRLKGIATTKDGVPYYYNTDNASGIDSVFDSMFTTIVSGLPIKNVTVSDVIDSRFELVEDTPSNATYDENSQTLIWENQTLPYGTEDSSGWTVSFIIKAKDEFMGGNVIPTNGSSSGVSLDGTTVPFPQPAVNVKSLGLDVPDKEITVFLGDTVQSIQDSINEINSVKAQKVKSDREAGDEGWFDIPKNCKISEAEILRLLNGDDTSVSKPYSYSGTADVVGNFVYSVQVVKTMKPEATGFNERFTADKVGEDQEEYQLTVQYVPIRQDNRNPGYDSYEHPENPNKNEESKTTSATGNYTVNVIAGQIVIKKEILSIETTEQTFKFKVEKEDGESYEASITISAGKTEGQASVEALSRGTYTVTEIESGDYSLAETSVVENETTCKFESSESGKFVIGTNTDGSNAFTTPKVENKGTVKFVNEKALARHWDILKVSDKNNEFRLNGAEFTLTKQGESAPAYIGKSEGTLVSGEDKGYVQWYQADSNGNATTDRETPEQGTYILAERKAPLGYTLSGETWTVEINANGSLKSISSSDGVRIKTSETTEMVGGEKVTVVHYLFENTAVFDLPSAGSSGIFGYTMGGTLLLMAGTLILYKMKRKEVQES